MLNADVAQRLQARIDENIAVCSGSRTIEGVIASSLRDRITENEIRGQWRKILNRRHHVDAHINDQSLAKTRSIPSFEQVDGGLTIVVMPVIAAILDVHAAENKELGGWLHEFAVAVTMGYLRDAERVMVRAQCEVNAYHACEGPVTAAVLAANLGVELVQPPPLPLLRFDRDRFPPFQEVTEQGRFSLGRMAKGEADRLIEQKSKARRLHRHAR